LGKEFVGLPNPEDIASHEPTAVSRDQDTGIPTSFDNKQKIYDAYIL